MKVNMSMTDRGIRLLVATVLILLVVTGSIPGGWVIAAWVVSIIFIITGSIGICPLYSFLGIRTFKRHGNPKV